MSKLYLPIILGTSRPGRWSEKVALFVEDIVKQNLDIETEIIDPKIVDIKYDGNNNELKNSEYSEKTLRADGFIIVSPEYNHGIPGSLKRLLDIEYNNYNYKPVFMVGVSDGPWGGVRMIEALIPILKCLKMIVLHADIQFPNVDRQFDTSGNLIDQKYIERVNRSLKELVWMSEVMKGAREQR